MTSYRASDNDIVQGYKNLMAAENYVKEMECVAVGLQGLDKAQYTKLTK